MFKFIDYILNRVPMYRITLYILVLLWIVAIGFGFLGMLPYGGIAIAMSGVFLILMSWLSNELLALILNVPVNHESAYITGLILALIVSPATSVSELGMLAVISLVAMGSKYILAIKKKHLFNPAAVAVVVMSFFGVSASWWIGARIMLPFVVVLGYLLVRKINREDMVFSFLGTTLVVGGGYYLFSGLNILNFLQQIIMSSGLIFLATVMLTEPMTTPPTRALRIIYGILLGVLILPFIHIGSIYFTPELALIIGNAFVYIVSPKYKLTLKLKKKVRLSEDLYDFVFESDRKFKFIAGQYLEWTLDNVAFNMKGNRRYLTIASAPSEREVRVGIRVQHPISEFKKEMLSLKVGDKVTATQLSGDFVLPKNNSKKLAFIAGGIGITPFRSMIKNMIDTKDSRAVTLFYTNKYSEDVIYKDVFEDARRKLDIKTVYTLTDSESIASNSYETKGRITADLIKEQMPDYKERFFYISGSLALVSGMKLVLRDLGVNSSNIKTDYFPGFV